jgi:hypothetical protein
MRRKIKKNYKKRGSETKWSKIKPGIINQLKTNNIIYTDVESHLQVSETSTFDKTVSKLYQRVTKKSDPYYVIY